MTRFSRRQFLVSGSMWPMAALLGSCTPGPDPAPTPTPSPNPSSGLTRPDASSPAGRNMLQIYATAVGGMKTGTPEESPTGWLFQWYTHGVRSDRGKASELMRIYPATGPVRDLANEMWDTCQAHRAGQIEDDFLPWHRMYVYYFERIVRRMSGNPEFVLPYWNYSAQGANHGVLPPELRDAASPLFEGNRNAGVNAGQPIDQNSPGALDLTALAQGRYSSSGASQGFCMGLDFGLHGAVHVLTGNDQNMGSVPWAANDPVFWMHHCNIDRLWASWNRNGGGNPLTDSRWMNQEFVFADEDGSRVLGRTSDFVDINRLGYTYDRFEPAPPGFQPVAPATPRITLLQANPSTRRATAVRLGAGPARALLQPAAPAPQGFGERVAALNQNGGRLHLVLRDLMAAAQPGVLYAVYLNLPEAPTEAELETSRVGYIHFFSSVAHAADDGVPPTEGRFYAFDVTDVAAGLGAAGALGDEGSVTIIPQGAPLGAAESMVGEILLVEE